MSSKGFNFNFMSNSTCFLRLLKENIQSTNKLEFNTRIHLKNFIVLSEKFSKDKVRVSSILSKVNLLLTRATKDPIGLVNSVW